MFWDHTVLNSDTPCQRVEHTMEDWIAKIENSMKALHLHMKLEQKKVIRNMEYICCTMPTSQGRLYNVIFETSVSALTDIKPCFPASSTMDN